MKKKFMEYIVCDCTYNNNPERLKIYGTCLRCGKILDNKAKYKYEMNRRLKIWKVK